MLLQIHEGIIRQTLIVHIASDTKHLRLMIGSNVVHFEVTEIHTFYWTEMLFEMLKNRFCYVSFSWSSVV